MTGAPQEDAPACLHINNEPSDLARAAAWVRTWAEQHRLPARTKECLDVCAAEAVSNVMTHAYADGAPHQIVLRLERQGEFVALEIEDDGMAFNPLTAGDPAPAASLEEARIGGWGIHIVRHLSDELRYHRASDRNCLTLIFRLTHTRDHDDPTTQATS